MQFLRSSFLMHDRRLCLRHFVGVLGRFYCVFRYLGLAISCFDLRLCHPDRREGSYKM